MLTRPDPITYLDHAANAGRAYKQRLLDALDLRPDHTALDIGCGPGTDLPAMAEQEDRARIDPVLHLVTDPTTALAELRRVLRPAGRAASTRLGNPRRRPGPGRHQPRVQPLRVRPGRALARLAREAGLTVGRPSTRITRPAADAWPADFTDGPFLAAFTLFRVTVSAA